MRKENEKLRNENEQLRNNNIVKDFEIIESIKIKSLEEDKNAADSYFNWFDKNKFKTFWLLLTAKHLITGIKFVNSSIMTLKTLSIILEIIHLVNYLLKKI